jgi:GAF domain-containing protein
MTSADRSGRPDSLEPLEHLGRLSLRDHSMQSLLQSVTDLASETMPDNAEASISVIVRDRPTTAVFSGDLARLCDESQYGHGYGPCLYAARTGEVVEVTDARTDPRWTDYMRRALQHGALGSLSVPLPISEGVVGALNIYVREPDAFDEESRAVAMRFAPYAGVAAAAVYAYQGARDVADNLQIALDSRAVIDQAKGILMERFKMTADQAFQALARESMQTNTKVRDVAERLVRTGEFPQL